MENLSPEQRTLLALLRRSLWGEQVEIPDNINWEQLDIIAKDQGVVSFICDGALKARAAVPEELIEKWKKRMIYGALTSERLLLSQDKMLQSFSQADIPAVILKGSSVARYYPQPELRVLGDIDVLVSRADLDRAQSILEQLGYIMYENDPGYHISFRCKRTSVELHYEVTGFPETTGGKITKQEAEGFLNRITQGAVSDHVFHTLSETDQGLSLLLHMIRHMFGSGIGLRQVCDWAMYVARTDAEVLETKTLALFDRCGLSRYAKVATKVCVQYLGLPGEHISWCADAAEEECRSFLENVFCEGNMGDANKEGIGGMGADGNTMGRKQNVLSAMLSRLTKLSYQHFPFVKKCKVLLPVFWIFLPVRYAVRSLLGLRPKKSVAKVIASANRQHNLYELLRPFETET